MNQPVADTPAVPTEGSADLRRSIQDSALNRVPDDQRISGWALAWMPMGIVTTLAVLLQGSMVAALVGGRLALVIAVLMAIFGSVVGWLLGHMAQRSGTSSTVTTRFHGLGVRGSALASAFLGFGIISALGLENALLYNGTLFLFGWDDTWLTKVAIYGFLTLMWIGLTTFGTALVRRVSGVLVVAFLFLLVYVVWRISAASAVSFGVALSQEPQTGDGGASEFITAMTILAVPAILLAVLGADYARWARSSRDVGVMMVSGNVMCQIVIVTLGVVIAYSATPIVEDYLVGRGLADVSGAAAQAQEIAATNTGAYFVILASVGGFLLMYAAQVKAQILNNYTGALALDNLFDTLFSWRPGHFFSICAASLLGLLFVVGGILPYLHYYLNAMGTALSALAAVMISAYYVTRDRKDPSQDVEKVNWAGVFSSVGATVIAMALAITGVFGLGFAVSFALAFAAYPLLRKTILPFGRWTTCVPATEALDEYDANDT